MDRPPLDASVVCNNQASDGQRRNLPPFLDISYRTKTLRSKLNNQSIEKSRNSDDLEEPEPQRMRSPDTYRHIVERTVRTQHMRFHSTGDFHHRHIIGTGLEDQMRPNDLPVPGMNGG